MTTGDIHVEDGDLERQWDLRAFGDKGCSQIKQSVSAFCFFLRSFLFCPFPDCLPLLIFLTSSLSPVWQRKEGVWDDEALQLTQQLLSSNPDFATLWNYRKEILMHLETVK